MIERVPMASADLGPDDIDAVTEVLRSGRLALGPKSVEFEEALASYVGVRYAVSVSSGTAALHLLVRALGISEGDEVLVPSFTFAASVNALLYERATPVFVDIEPYTYNMDVAEVESKITSRTKAIMVVDVFGHPAEWDAINAIAEKNHLMVIDDSCEGIGARYRGRLLGQFGEGACFAFYPNKQITSGEGGALVTDNHDLAKVCRSMRNQGRGETGQWLEHERLGFNYRLDEMSAALALSQLRKLELFLQKREMVARLYTEKLTGLRAVGVPITEPHVRRSWFVYVVTLPEGWDRAPIMKSMASQGIPTRAYFSPIHQQPYMRAYLDRPVHLPVTEAVAPRTLALPFHNNLSESQIDEVVAALREAVIHYVEKPT